MNCLRNFYAGWYAIGARETGTWVREASLKIIEIGDFRIDRDTLRASIRNRKVRLTLKEFKLLVYLAKHPSRIIGHSKIGFRNLGRGRCRTAGTLAGAGRTSPQEDRAQRHTALHRH